MRRTASISAGILGLTLVASVALASTISIADSFPQRTFGGNTGTKEWEDNWNELPESQQEGALEGPVQVVNSGCPGGSNCLAIMGEGLTLGETGAFRHGDLSVFANANLSFKMKVDLPGPLNLTNATAILWVKAYTGGPWSLLDSYPLLIHEGTSQKSIPLSSGFLHKDFGVSFVVTGLLDGDVLIDDVVISGSPVPPTTTSTTSTSTSTTLPVTTTSLPITTTLPTITTTTLPGLLTTSTSTTTTTTKSSTSTTGAGATTTSTTSGTSVSEGPSGGSGGSGGDGTTVTTSASVESTIPGQAGEDAVAGPSRDPGLREASVGLQASFEGGRFGNVEAAELEVMGISIEPNYTMAVEVIESSWVYLLVLILLIATAIVSGLDRRRLKRAKHTDV